MNNNGHKVNWRIVKEFEDSGILIQVSMSDSRRPRYTIRIGRRGTEEGHVVSFLPLFTEGQGKITVRSITDAIARLVDLAETWVQEAAQIDEDEWIAARIAKDEKSAERDGKKRKPSGYKQARSA